jgi:hypothetical protein
MWNSRLSRLLAILFAFAYGASWSAPAAAQNAATTSTVEAEAVVRKAFVDIDSLRWAGAAALVHPQTLARFRASAIDQARSAARYQNAPYPTDPDMPPEVAAWHREQYRKRREEQQFGSALSHLYAGIDSLAQLEVLTAEEMFARHLQARDPRELLKANRPESRNIPPATLRELEVMFRTQRTVIGATVENDSTVQIVYRTQFPAVPDGEQGGVAVVEVRRTPVGWRLWSGARDPALFDDVQNMAFGFIHDTDEEIQTHLRELANRVITWTIEGGGEGRAFVVGYTGGTEPPTALAIEIQRPNQAKIVVHIPIEQFARVAELLMSWPEPNPRRE